MMFDDELKTLAADIKANGLRDALVIAEVDEETVLVDGRNRRTACKMAGVEPTTRRLNGLSVVLGNWRLKLPNLKHLIHDLWFWLAALERIKSRGNLSRMLKPWPGSA